MVLRCAQSSRYLIYCFEKRGLNIHSKIHKQYEIASNNNNMQ